MLENQLLQRGAILHFNATVKYTNNTTINDQLMPTSYSRYSTNDKLVVIGICRHVKVRKIFINHRGRRHRAPVLYKHRSLLQ